VVVLHHHARAPGGGPNPPAPGSPGHLPWRDQ